jgi:hypothetical protein
MVIGVSGGGFWHYFVCSFPCYYYFFIAIAVIAFFRCAIIPFVNYLFKQKLDSVDDLDRNVIKNLTPDHWLTEEKMQERKRTLLEKHKNN